MVWLGVLAIYEEGRAHGLNQVPKLIQNPAVDATDTVHFVSAPIFERERGIQLTHLVACLLVLCGA